MFGGNMMEKLQKMQGQMETIKKRLDTITVQGGADDGKVVVHMNGNRKVTDIKIDASLLSKDVEELEDLLVIATNRAIESANSVNEAEMQSAAMGMMPNLK